MTSLRQQLTRTLLGVLAVLLGVGLVSLYVAVWDEMTDAFDAMLRARAAAVAARVEQDDGRIRFDFSDEFLRDYGGERTRNYFEIWDADGKRLRRSPSLRHEDLERPERRDANRARFENVTLPNGRRARAIELTFVPETGEGERPRNRVRSAQLVVAVDRDELDETLGVVALAVGGCSVLLLGGVLLVVPWVLRRGLAPVERLANEMARVDADSLTAQLPVAGLPAELRIIGDRMNDLLARLAASFERERRFSADVAHELRTPLAELRSLAECAIKWPDSRDPATDREVLAIATQMEALVTRMLTLARGERRQIAATLGPVDGAGIVLEAWRPFQARAEARSLRAVFEVTPAIVRADAALFRAIVTNLFDNAVAHAPAGSELRVSGVVSGGHYTLRFANPAGDFTAEDAAKLFERFWRKEAARSGGEHFGLGLNLARTFAQAMGWTLDATLEAGGVLVFTLRGPLDSHPGV